MEDMCSRCNDEYATTWCSDLGWVCSECYKKSEDYKPGGGYPHPSD
jgi:hypothetical protein